MLGMNGQESQNNDDVLHLGEEKIFKETGTELPENPAEELNKLYQEIYKEFRRFEEVRLKRIYSISDDRDLHQRLLNHAVTDDPRLLVKEIITKKDHLRFEVCPKVQGKIKYQPKVVLDAFMTRFLYGICLDVEDRIQKDIISLDALTKCLTALYKKYSVHLSHEDRLSLQANIEKFQDRLLMNNKFIELTKAHKKLKSSISYEKDSMKLKLTTMECFSLIADTEYSMFSGILDQIRNTLKYYQKVLSMKIAA